MKVWINYYRQFRLPSNFHYCYDAVWNEKNDFIDLIDDSFISAQKEKELDVKLSEIKKLI